MPAGPLAEAGQYDPNKLLDVVAVASTAPKHDLSIVYVAESSGMASFVSVVRNAEGGHSRSADVGLSSKNLSGEDWTKLRPRAGRREPPFAFLSQSETRHSPSFPPRPVVEHSGDVIAAVAHGETTLANAPVIRSLRPPPAVDAPAPEMRR